MAVCSFGGDLSVDSMTRACGAWMHPVTRSLVVFSVSSALSLGVLYVAGDDGGGFGGMEAAASSRREHELSRLRVVHEALAPVAESYVEPDRVRPDRMFTEALEAVERLVPEVMFRREGQQLSVHVGIYRTVLELPPIEDTRALERELRRVATLLEEHLDPSDIPHEDAEIDPFASIEFAMGNGMLATLDPHSALLPPEQSREMDVENRGAFGGLGINIQLEDDRLLVERALPGKPAARAGVREGDQIRRIDGQSTINLTIDEAVELLRGPEGAPVTLEIVREGEARPREVVVERANIKINEVEGYTLTGGVAYVRIPSFHATVQADLAAQLRRLTREEGQIRGLVLDLRDNPGGYLNQAIAVADTFLSEGEIVSTRGAYDRRPQTEYARSANTEEPYPIAVLVNAHSASASEIVAGALRNNQRAVIVGERTFGKGSVQNLHALPYDSKLKITIAHYLTPGERSIQSVGIPADIELVPALIGPRDEDGAKEQAAMLFSRRLIEREVDLDEHLGPLAVREEPAMYTVPYRAAWDAHRDTFGPPDVANDVELALAVDLLRIAPRGLSNRMQRGDMLAAAGPLVRRYAADGDRRITEAFAAMGVDWSAGPTPADVDLDVRLQVGQAGFLHAGRQEEVTLTVTNRGTAPVHRLVGWVPEHEILGGAEFFLGRLAPGETRTWTRPVRVEQGWPTEVTMAPLELRTGDGEVLLAEEARVVVEGHDLPRLAWSWRLATPAGNPLAVGDLVRLELEVSNVGTGVATGATGRIRNRSGRALDVLGGTVHAGRMVAPDGAPCGVTEPGWIAGMAVGTTDLSHPRVKSRLPPVYPDDCTRVLAPGEAWSGSFEVEVLEPLDGNYRLDLSVEDEASYDHGSIVRGGFYSYYRQEEEIRFSLGEIPRRVPVREPPRIDLSLAPPSEVHQGLVTLSGRVADADGVDHVVVYADDDKVFYEGGLGGRALPSIPFTADIELTPGLHTLSVLARDAAGFSTTVSRSVHRVGEVWQARAPGSRDERVP